MILLLEEIFRTGQVRTVDALRAVPLDSAITPDVGFFLQDIIRRRKPKTVVEVAWPSKFLHYSFVRHCKNAAAFLMSLLSPHQSTLWYGIDMNNLKLAGLTLDPQNSKYRTAVRYYAAQNK